MFVKDITKLQMEIDNLISVHLNLFVIMNSAIPWCLNSLNCFEFSYTSMCLIRKHPEYLRNDQIHLLTIFAKNGPQPETQPSFLPGALKNRSEDGAGLAPSFRREDDASALRPQRERRSACGTRTGAWRDSAIGQCSSELKLVQLSLGWPWAERFWGGST